MTLMLTILFSLLVPAVAGIMILNTRRRRAAALLEKQQTNRRLVTVVANKVAKPAKEPAKLAVKSATQTSVQHFIPKSGEKVRYRTTTGKLLVARVAGFENGGVRLWRHGHTFTKMVTDIRPRRNRLWAEIAAAA